MRSLLLALAILVLFGATNAAAAPLITIKGRTTLRVVGIYPGDDGAILVGRLLDRDLDTGIAGRVVRVELLHEGRRQTFRAQTDAEGEFRITLPPGLQTYQVEARFTGDDSYAADAPPPEALDVTKLTPEIGLEMDRELDLSQPQHRLELVTRAEGRNVSLPVSVRLEGSGELARVTTDENGRAALSIPTERLGTPGPLTIVARFAGNGELNPTRAQHEALLVSSVTLTMQAERTAVQPEEKLRLTGSVSDARGALDGATIGLEAMGRHVASTLSERGRFRFELRAEDFPPGPVDLVARFSPTVLWRRPAASPSVQVTVLPPTPIPPRLYLIPVVMTALIMLALLAVRFWPDLRLREPREQEESPAPDDPAPEPIESGVRLSRTSLRSFVKPAFDLHGTVWNPVDRKPVAGARVLLRRDEDSVEVLALTSDQTGRFGAKDLPAGTLRVEVSKPGFVSESFRAQIPHRGNLHGLRVDLVEVRVRLLEIYRTRAVSLLPRQKLWARWTPRELCHHVGSRAGRRDPGLEGLSRLLEQAYWSATPPGEALLTRARSLADEILG